MDKTTTGDGIVVSLQVLSIMVKNCMSLYELCKNICLLPQILINVCCFGIDHPLNSNLIKKEVKLAEQELCGNGRIILRHSGTEPYVRIMVEGKCYEKILFLANKIASVIKSEIETMTVNC